jgi:hypothetical protein
MTILEAMDDPNLFGQVFKKGTWTAWRAFLAALFALPMNSEALELYRKHTGRMDPPAEQCGEAYCIGGRRSGKSFLGAFVATVQATFRDYSPYLAPGETGVFMVLAADRKQASVIFRYILGFFDSIALLGRMVESRLKESIVLNNRITIAVHTSNYKSTRGYTVVGCIADELAFWPSDDSASPDSETLNAIRPAMATIPNALLLGLSSPYARRGVLWEAHRDYFGKPGAPVLVWKAATRDMNPGVSRLLIAAAYVKDPASARAEYGAEFRDDTAGFVTEEIVNALIIPGRFELPPVEGVTYSAFCDPSGGQSDSMTLAIVHRDKDRAVLDLIREVRAPFSPESVVTEFCGDLKRYQVSVIKGDRYAGEWPAEQFQKRNIVYKPSELSRSELYLELLPALMSGQCELLDNERLRSQLVGLERRTARGGRDSVDHSPGAHDDIANAVAGALVGVLGGLQTLGLVEWMKLIAAKVLSPDGTPIPVAEPEPAKTITAIKPNLAPPVEACPACGAVCVVRSYSGWRCNQCGNQFGGSQTITRAAFVNGLPGLTVSHNGETHTRVWPGGQRGN